MALIHIVPEGIHTHEAWAKEKQIDNPFPLPYVLIFMGYLLVLVIDRVLSGWLLRLMGKEHEAHIGHSHGSKQSHPPSTEANPEKVQNHVELEDFSAADVEGATKRREAKEAKE